MQDDDSIVSPPLAGLSKADWLLKLADIGGAHGYFLRLSEKHFSTLVEESSSLLVTFETIQGIRALDENAQPLGWDTVRATGWSHLALISDGDTWFRDPKVYTYFDQLEEDGFFDEFDRVVFYGAGPCGYAAAAFSVTAPGSTVLAIQPQATLNPEVTGWDERFTEERRLDFTTRYGYAPDMIDAAEQAFIVYDPSVTLDAMHAALFTRPNVIKLPTRRMGATIQTHLMEMGLMQPLLRKLAHGQLSRTSFAKMMRARRDYPPYLRTLLSRLDAEERTDLVARLCRNVTSRMSAPKFARRLKDLS